MGLRFRRTVKIAPGIRWNIGARGSSLSFGPRGASINVGRRGVRGTIGLPGTGLSYTEKLGGPAGAAFDETAQPLDPSLALRMGVQARPVLRGIHMTGLLIALGAGAVSVISGAPSGMFLAGLFVLFFAERVGRYPTREQLAIAERDRRIEVLRPLVEGAASVADIEIADARCAALCLASEDMPELAASLEHKRAELQRPPEAPAIVDDGPVWRECDDAENHGFMRVVGESAYQETLRSLDFLFTTIERSERTFVAKLVPEPDNAYDANAVAVKTEGDATVGYLPRDVARTYQKHIVRQPQGVRCPAQLVGGTEGKEHIGVVLDFEKVYRLRLVSKQRTNEIRIDVP